MKTLTEDQVVEVYLDTSMCPLLRPCINADDWGDPRTVKLHLKRQGATPLSPWDHFGFYLGFHEIGYVVAVKGVATNKPVSGEVFETLEEMKQRWQLD